MIRQFKIHLSVHSQPLQGLWPTHNCECCGALNMALDFCVILIENGEGLDLLGHLSSFVAALVESWIWCHAEVTRRTTYLEIGWKRET